MGCLRLTYWQKSLGLKVEKGNLNPLSNSSAGVYRYGFNGMEKDDEVSGQGNSYTTHFRAYDSRLGRWKSIDPVTHPNESSYMAFNNNPVVFNDPRGDTPPGEGTPKTHEVEKGNTLGGLSKEYGISLDKLRKANPQTQERSQPDQINIGENITLPGHYTYEDKTKKSIISELGNKGSSDLELQLGGSSLGAMKKFPPNHPDYKVPKGGDRKVKNPNGRGNGWVDRKGDVWIPTDHKGTHAPHWDRQHPDGSHTNVYPIIKVPKTTPIIPPVIISPKPFSFPKTMPVPIVTPVIFMIWFDFLDPEYFNKGIVKKQTM